MNIVENEIKEDQNLIKIQKQNLQINQLKKKINKQDD